MALGDPAAPLLGLLAALAGFGAVLAGGRADSPPALLAAAGSVATALALAAAVLATAQIAGAFGAPPDHALAGSVAVAAAGMILSRVPVLPAAALLLGALTLAALVAAMAVGSGAPPWTAWARLASQPARVFAPSSPWVTEGRALRVATELEFTEIHRLTALSSGVVRVVEPGTAGRERRVAPGDALSVRPGDRLALPAGLRLRFEAGKRMPGVAESGVAWAEPRARAGPRALASALGMALTLGGGAVAVAGACRGASPRGALLAPLALLVLVPGTAAWGVYAAWLAPDLGIGDSPLTLLAAVPSTAGLSDLGPEAITALAVGGGALLFATAGALLRQLDGFAAPWAPSRVAVRAVPGLLGLGALASAVGLAGGGVEAEPVLRVALGLGASAWAAPRLVGESRAAAIGAGAGALAFVALALAGQLGLDGPGGLEAFPALGAAPLALVVAALARRGRGRARAARRSRPLRAGCPQGGTLPQ